MATDLLPKLGYLEQTARAHAKVSTPQTAGSHPSRVVHARARVNQGDRTGRDDWLQFSGADGAVTWSDAYGRLKTAGERLTNRET
ncbi:MAG TPA: hypothetical protein VGN42_26335 [Pirellulales bacterium]|nr:hypothetical protein [Pirellulales bacterium]